MNKREEKSILNAVKFYDIETGCNLADIDKDVVKFSPYKDEAMIFDKNILMDIYYTFPKNLRHKIGYEMLSDTANHRIKNAQNTIGKIEFVCS